MAKSHPIYTDLTLNSPLTVYKNIHQAFMLAAMKMHAYIKATGKRGVSGLAFVLQERSPSFGLESRRKGKCDNIVGYTSSMRNQKHVRKGGDFLLSESFCIWKLRARLIDLLRHYQAVNSIYLFIDQE